MRFLSRWFPSFMKCNSSGNDMILVTCMGTWNKTQYKLFLEILFEDISYSLYSSPLSKDIVMIPLMPINSENWGTPVIVF